MAEKFAPVYPEAIWKFAIPMTDLGEFTLELPKDFQIVHVGCKFHIEPGQRVVPELFADPNLWVQVDPTATKAPVVFQVVATGQDFNSAQWTHVGTFVQGRYVWHLLKKVP